MAGIRLRHPTLRSCVYVVELDKNLLREPGRVYHCPTCQREHTRKALHLRLDNGGTTMVSQTTAPETLSVLRLAGLEPENTVDTPPATHIGAVAQPRLEIVTLSLGQASREHYVPERTQYESRDNIIRPFQPVIDAAAEQVDRRETAEKAKKRTIFSLGG